MTIIEAQKHLDGEHLKQFIESAKTDVIIFTNASLSFKFEFPKSTFIKDFLEIEDAAIDGMSGNDELLLISDDVILQTLVNDYRWYHGSARRINRLLSEVYEGAEMPKVKKQISKQVALAQKDEEMKKERIFALMLADDVDGISAFKGTGYQCLDWLNRQLVIHYDRLDDIKLHLNLTESSSISEFKTIKELIEEGSIIL